MSVANLLKRLDRIGERVKRIEWELELGGTLINFDWADLTERDKLILNTLLRRGRTGATTTKIAELIELESPEGSGRAIVYARLKRIERISKRLKGAPIVIPERRRWYLNFDEFKFSEVKQE